MRASRALTRAARGAAGIEGRTRAGPDRRPQAKGTSGAAPRAARKRPRESQARCKPRSPRLGPNRRSAWRPTPGCSTAMRTIDTARTLGEVLDTLGTSAAAEAGARACCSSAAAVSTAGSSHGFGPSLADPVVHVAIDAPALATGSQRTSWLEGREASDAPLTLFGGPVAVRVRSAKASTAYAGAGTRRPPGARRSKSSARHAARALEALTAIKAARIDRRRPARVRRSRVTRRTGRCRIRPRAGTRSCSCRRSSCITRPQWSQAAASATWRRGSAERFRGPACCTNSAFPRPCGTAPTISATSWCDARQRGRDPVATAHDENHRRRVSSRCSRSSCCRRAARAAAGCRPPLKPTNHVRLPPDPDSYWLAPSPATRRAAKTPAMTQFAEGVKLEVDDELREGAADLLAAGLQQGPLGDYAMYYQGLAELRLGRPADAKRTFQALAGEIAGRDTRRRRRAPRGGERRGARRSGGGARDLRAAVEDQDHGARRRADAPRARGESVGRQRQGRAGVPARRLRVPVQRSRRSPRRPSSTRCRRRRSTPGSARYKLELGRAERLFGAKRYTQARPVFEALRRDAAGRRPRARRPAARRVRLLPEARAQRARRRQAVHREGLAAGRGAVLLRRRDARARRPRRVPAHRPPHRRRVPDAELGRRSAEQSGHALHPAGRRRAGRRDVPRAVRRSFPTGRYAERAAWKIGWRAYRSGKLRGHRSRAFERRPRISRGRTIARVAVLVGPRARSAQGRRRGRRALHARRDRLPEHLLRPAGGRAADGPRRPRAAASARRRTRRSPADRGRRAADRALPPNDGDRPRAARRSSSTTRRSTSCATRRRSWGDSPAIQATLGWILQPARRFCAPASTR